MSASAGSAQLEEQVRRRRVSQTTVAVGSAAVVAGGAFGAILAMPLDVRPWIATLLAAAYALVVVGAVTLLLRSDDSRGTEVQ